jgi:hypothetical protein
MGFYTNMKVKDFFKLPKLYISLFYFGNKKKLKLQPILKSTCRFIETPYYFWLKMPILLILS